MGLWRRGKPAVVPETAGGALPAGPWQAPSAVEAKLFEAKTRSDWAGYLAVLARTSLFLADTRDHADSHPDTVTFIPHRHPQTGARYLAVFTEGMLPPPTPELVFHGGSLDWYARAWKESDPPWLAVNPGTPCEAFLPTSPERRADWRRHASQTHHHPHGELRTLHVGGPLQGPVAHGLACAALLFVKNGELWNAMAYHGGGYHSERDRLKEWWGITSREEWQQTQRDLLDADQVSPVWEYALGIRRTLARDFAGQVDVDLWRQAAEQTLRHRAAQAAEPRITPDGVTAAEPGHATRTEARITGVQRLIGRIARYEARFRADGILSENAFVPSVEAWDYGRASGMARWALGARYATLQEAEQAVTRAGYASQTNYRSWEEFSASYILGRCLHFDEEEFGTWYEDMLAAHRVLTTDPESPWLTIPWK
ncbi:DUF1266 domain-containing protein [Streptomyces sp. SAJ15]|uniref:DUF1266 domain-containing protein n=1 Tax=Streptomyces sp. SAJ15 TaxID=2011095 RepID=UPI0011852688|nr:DUF1266 domain-containing protein [Streptomyces sp. SAJ15]TVL91028.1 hypothetical protein CD790_17090 [Streptomyces sp. SAJ15]